MVSMEQQDIDKGYLTSKYQHKQNRGQQPNQVGIDKLKPELTQQSETKTYRMFQY